MAGRVISNLPSPTSAMPTAAFAGFARSKFNPKARRSVTLHEAKRRD
jgi:hypothetical protein